MNSNRITYSIIILILYFILLNNFTIQAQCNSEEGGATCQVAPLVCLNNLCDATEQNQPDGSYNGWCGPNTAIHNPQYFPFIPIFPDVFFEVTVSKCSGGQNALQAAIINACPWTGANEVLDCTPGTPEGSTFTLQATGLVVGQIYYLVFDGSAGSQCDYTIEQATGVFTPQLTNDLETVEADPTYVCQGYDNLMLTVSPEVENAHGYWWVPSWDGDTIETTDPILTLDIPYSVPGGNYEICVRAFSGCDTADFELCIEVAVYEIPDEVKPRETFCPEEFPFDWGNVDITGPNEYFQNFTTAEGCFFDSIWIVDEYLMSSVTILDTLHCGPSLIYEGTVYDSTGIYNLHYPNMGLYGCDSTAKLNVMLASIDASITLNCENEIFILRPTIQNLTPLNVDPLWTWYNEGLFITNDSLLYTIINGQYQLLCSIVTEAGDCNFNIDTFMLIVEDYLPSIPFIGYTDTLVCAQDNIIFEVIEDPESNQQSYIWSAPLNVSIVQDGSNRAEFDFSSSQGGQICVYSKNECGMSSTTCFNVEVSPSISFDFTHTIENKIVQFMNEATGLVEYIWSFGDGAVGSGANPSHSYTEEGIFTVELIGTSSCGIDTIRKSVNTTGPSDELNNVLLLTPNGDNVNDLLIIEGIEVYPNNELTIVNRWGDVVYKANPYMNDWGGEGSSGGLLTQGTYYFILRNVGGTLPQGGNIVILK